MFQHILRLNKSIRKLCCCYCSNSYHNNDTIYIYRRLDSTEVKCSHFNNKFETHIIIVDINTYESAVLYSFVSRVTPRHFQIFIHKLIMKYHSKLCVYIVGGENIMLALYRDVSYNTYPSLRSCGTLISFRREKVTLVLSTLKLKITIQTYNILLLVLGKTKTQIMLSTEGTKLLVLCGDRNR